MGITIMSNISAYNIDLWNAAFELKSIATKWGVDVIDLYNDLHHIVNSDELMDGE